MNYNSILPNETLFIGDYITSQNLSTLTNLKVTHIISVGFQKGYFPNKFKYLTIDIKDDPTENILMFLPRAVSFIEDALDNHNGVVYVHCVHGQSRSCTVVIAFFMHQYWKNPMSSILSNQNDVIQYDTRKQLLHYCYNHVMACRPCMAINPGFVKQLELYRQMKMIQVQNQIRTIRSPILSQPHATFRSMKAKSEFYNHGNVRVFVTMNVDNHSEVYVCKKCSMERFGPENICLELSTEELDQLPTSEYWSSSKGGLEYYATYRKRSDIFRDFENALHLEKVFKVEPLDWMKSCMVEDYNDSLLRSHGTLICKCGQKLGYWDFCCNGEYPMIVLQSRVEKRVHRSSVSA